MTLAHLRPAGSVSGRRYHGGVDPGVEALALGAAVVAAGEAVGGRAVDDDVVADLLLVGAGEDLGQDAAELGAELWRKREAKLGRGPVS